MSILPFLSKLKELNVNIGTAKSNLIVRAPRGALTPALIDELKDKKEEILTFFQKNVMIQVKYGAVQPVEKKEYYPLSSAQKRMYVVHQTEPGNTGYNMPDLVTLEGNVDKEALEEAFKKLVARHESLRTSFEIVNEETVQRVHHEVEFHMEYYDSYDSNALPGTEAVISRFVRPFDLSKVPLLRVGFLENSPQGPVLLIDMHHIITDGVSLNVLTDEFTALYRGEELPVLRLQYRDYAQWRNSPEERERIKRQEEFWLREFKGDIPVLNLPIDFPRLKVSGFEGAAALFALEKEHTAALQEIAGREGATSFIVLLAVYNVFLSKICGQEDIVIGTSTAGRNHADLEKIIGMFVNTVALRNYPHGDKTFEQFLTDVKEKTIAAFNNQDYPFEDLVSKIIKTKEMSRNPIFDVRFTFNTIEDEEPGEWTGAPGPAAQLNPISKFDMTLYGVEMGNHLEFKFQYRTQLFKEFTMERFTRYFKEVVAAVVKNPGVLLKDIRISHDFTPVESKAAQLDLDF